MPHPVVPCTSGIGLHPQHSGALMGTGQALPTHQGQGFIIHISPKLHITPEEELPLEEMQRCSTKAGPQVSHHPEVQHQRGLREPPSERD